MTQATPIKKLLWEFCDEVIESQETIGTNIPAWFVVNVPYPILGVLGDALENADYFCTSLIPNGKNRVIVKLEFATLSRGPA